MRTKRLEKTLSALIPAAVGYRDELPEVPPETVVEALISHFRGSELVLAMRGALFILNIFSLLFHGKLLKNLDREKQDYFLMRCMKSRFTLLRGVAFLLKLPIHMYYYDQDVVLQTIGYNREELCADADKHQVTR